MDGFFVAKFKVTKRAKQAKEENEGKDNILMNEDVALEDIQFDEREDEKYIQGKSMRVDMHYGFSSWLIFSTEAKRRRLKAKGLRVPPRNHTRPDAIST
jgi:25S rRNA (cytosine2870-C5)-methyltransferase